MSRARFAFVADDFTGATDTLATLALAGLRTRLYLDAAGMAKDGESDAVGLATAARSLAPAEMARVLEPAAAALRGMPARVVHYKTCSTFDSAPQVGSIGAAAGALRKAVDNPFLPVVGGQPNLGRYCLFGNLFAAAGDGTVHRIDRHPTMSRHPVTPMHEADLRKHLAAQGLRDLESVAYPSYAGPIEPARAPVLFDVAGAADLAPIGRVIWGRAREGRLLAVGPSSVAQALIKAWREEGSLAAPTVPPPPARAAGPVLVLSGSQSPVSAAQIAAAASYEKLEAGASGAARRCVELLRAGRNVLAHTGGIRGLSGPAVAAAGARWLAEVLREVPLQRIGISGGDTSSHAVKALGVESLEYFAQLAPGVALCRAAGMELMLKGGQMGGPDIFERLIAPEGNR